MYIILNKYLEWTQNKVVNMLGGMERGQKIKNNLKTSLLFGQCEFREAREKGKKN